jgi:DNA-binding response OmpR family regulator
VLVVEDDPRIRQSLVLALTDEGYLVDAVGTGEDGLVRLQADAPDVIVLDVMLPGLDGFACCREMRKMTNIPIVMVTARADTHDVVAGLEAGADDYVTKPFVVKELAARLRAVARRSNVGTSAESARPSIRVGPLEIRPEQAEVLRRGELLRLTATEFKLLHALALEGDRVVSREKLLERVWEYDYLGDVRLVDVHIRRLRQKIEDDPGEPSLLLTVRGMGYRLAPGAV